MNEIQKARDMLAKWREGATPGPWTLQRHRYTQDGSMLLGNCPPPCLIADFSDARPRSDVDAALIVGTAGNPDLLDAIDMAFVALLNEDPLVSTVTSQCVEAIAAAIIAAAERMQQ